MIPSRLFFIETVLLILLTLCSSYCYAETQVIEIEIKGHKFIPNVIKAKGGSLIHLIVHNRDDIVEEFESHDLNREKLVPANSSIKIVLAPLEPGSYSFFGDFHQDTAQGTLIIEDETKAENDKEIKTENNT